MKSNWREVLARIPYLKFDQILRYPYDSKCVAIYNWIDKSIADSIMKEWFEKKYSFVKNSLMRMPPERAEQVFRLFENYIEIFDDIVFNSSIKYQNTEIPFVLKAKFIAFVDMPLGIGLYYDINEDTINDIKIKVKKIFKSSGQTGKIKQLVSTKLKKHLLTILPKEI